MTFAEETRQVQQHTEKNRGRFKPTKEMVEKQQSYLKMLEDRKKGNQPLYVTANGREYGNEHL